MLGLSSKIRVGDKAIDFTLPDVDMNFRNLRDFLGQKTVLAFSVSAFTSRCTKEMCEFRDFMARLINLKAYVIGISLNDPFTNSDLVEKNKLRFPILWDYKRQVFKDYGLESEIFPVYDDSSYSKSAILILDPIGVVRYVWVSSNPEPEPNYQEIQNKIEELP